MKCLLCPATIEPKAIHADDVNAQRVHAKELEAWRFVTVRIGNQEVIAGHICPDEKSVELKKAGSK